MNDRKRRWLRAILLGSVCWSGLLAEPAQAAEYLGKGHFPTPKLKWAFKGTASDPGGSYTAPAGKGTAGWQSATNLVLTPVDSGWHIAFNVQDYGDTGRNGYAYICNTTGNCDDQKAWDSTFALCTARINTNYLKNHSQERRQNTMMHESGHCFSLAHRADQSSLMYVFQTSVVSPNQDDKKLVNTRHAASSSPAQWVSAANTVPEQIREADAVVRVRVESLAESRILEFPLGTSASGTPYVDRIPFTDARLRVLEIFAGQVGDVIEVMQTGDLQKGMPDDPLFEAGAEYVLFLVDISGDPVHAPNRRLYRTVNPAGRYRIDGDRVSSPPGFGRPEQRPTRLEELVAEIWGNAR